MSTLFLADLGALPPTATVKVQGLLDEGAELCLAPMGPTGGSMVEFETQGGTALFVEVDNTGVQFCRGGDGYFHHTKRITAALRKQQLQDAALQLHNAARNYELCVDKPPYGHVLLHELRAAAALQPLFRKDYRVMQRGWPKDTAFTEGGGHGLPPSPIPTLRPARSAKRKHA